MRSKRYSDVWCVILYRIENIQCRYEFPIPLLPKRFRGVLIVEFVQDRLYIRPKHTSLFLHADTLFLVCHHLPQPLKQDRKHLCELLLTYRIIAIVQP